MGCPVDSLVASGNSLILVYESYHAEAGRAEAVAAVVVAEARVEDEQRLVSVEYAAEVANHFFLC